MNAIVTSVPNLRVDRPQTVRAKDLDALVQSRSDQ